ncbi:hypothetical protein [Legionella quinlivanii]|nr:hypothetical protein [Legionella quinlivanii]
MPSMLSIAEAERQNLFSRLEATGFIFHRESDTDNLCQNHEYCFLARSEQALYYQKALAAFKNESPKSEPYSVQHRQFGLLNAVKRDTAEQDRQQVNIYDCAAP